MCSTLFKKNLFIECILYAKLHALHVFISFDSHNSRREVLLLSPAMDEETEVYEGYETCSKTPNLQMAEIGSLKPGLYMYNNIYLEEKILKKITKVMSGW